MARHTKALRLLLTRPAEDCAKLAETLTAHGFFSDCLPLLAIEPVTENTEQRRLILALDEYQTVLVVSKAAAQLALARADRYWPQPPAGPSWFTPGKASGQILQDYGLPVYWPQNGDTSEAMLALPKLRLAMTPAGKALIICGEGGRHLLAEKLRAAGVAVDTLVLYRRVLPDYPVGILLQRIQQQRLNALYVSSAQGLQHLTLLAAENWHELADLPLFVPSERVAGQARLAGAKQVIDCGGASSAALLAALHQY